MEYCEVKDETLSTHDDLKRPTDVVNRSGGLSTAADAIVHIINIMRDIEHSIFERMLSSMLEREDGTKRNIDQSESLKVRSGVDRTFLRCSAHAYYESTAGVIACGVIATCGESYKSNRTLMSCIIAL